MPASKKTNIFRYQSQFVKPKKSVISYRDLVSLMRILRFFAFRSPDAKDMRRSVTTRTRDSSLLLTTPRATARPLIQVPPYLGLQHGLSYRYHHISGYSTASHTGTTTSRATARPLIQVLPYLGLQYGLSYRYHHISGYSTQGWNFCFVFLCFLGFFVFFCPDERVFRVFCSFTNTFRCIQTLNYNHSY